MSKTNVKSAKRVLAIVLAVMMVFTMFPLAAMQGFAASTDYPNHFTITVTDGTNPVDSAKVTISVNGMEIGAKTTDTNGIVAFAEAEIQGIMTNFGVTSFNADIKVEKAGYVTAEKTTTVDSDNITGNLNVTLTSVPASKATVSVTVNGNATVSVNGVQQNAATVDVGTEVPVEITPVSGAYIKELKIDGETVNVTKGQAYTGTVKADSNVVITATVVKEFAVTVPSAEGGKVTLNGNETESLMVDENSNVDVSVTADEGYYISSVSIGGEIQTLISNTTFNTTKKIDANTRIDVAFVRVYKVTVSFNGNGAVVTDPALDGGKVTVVTGSTVKVTATPEANYRVSEVLIDGVADANVTGANNSGYTKDLTADKDYDVVVTFAPNRFAVTKTETANGTINLSSNLVDYGSNCVVTVTPAEGYSIKTIKVNGVVPNANDIHAENGIATFTVENITEDTEISATFDVTSNSEEDYEVLFNGEDAVHHKGMTYVYKYNKDGTVIFATDKSGILLFNGKQLVGGGNGTKKVTINESTKITDIYLYETALGFIITDWLQVKGVSAENPLNIVVDTTAPTTKFTPDAKHSNNFYNNNFGVAINTIDEGDCSGIKSIEYFVTDKEIAKDVEYEDVADELKTQKGTIESYSDTGNSTGKGNVNISVSENTNNSDYVTLWTKVVDYAGNVEYKRSENFLVNCTPPSLVSIVMDGVLHPEATAGYYNAKRTATITIVDRASSFSAAAATDGINIVVNNGVTISKPAMVKWTNNGDYHVATVTFDTNARYTWDMSYTNLAGVQMDTSNVVKTGDSISEFVIDINDSPIGSIAFDDDNTWNDIINVLTFGVFTKNSLTATVKDVTDEISETYDVLYYKSNETKALTAAELDQLYAEGKFVKDEFTVEPEEMFVIYARLTDYAGNTRYISTEGAIIDTTACVIDIAPTTAPNENGIFNKDVEVQITVKDEGIYSGIKSVSYEIINRDNNNEVTDSDTLFTFDDKHIYNVYPQLSDLKDDFTEVITVNAEANNADHIEIVVKAIDNAGNEITETETIAINVDPVTAEITFDGEANQVHDGRGFFAMDERTATIKIPTRESAFDAEAATNGVKVTAKDKAGKNVANAYEVSEWKLSEDKTYYSAEVTFKAGAYYDWSFNYTNKADNSLAEKDITTNGDTPFCFTVDNDKPTGTVSTKENFWSKLAEVLTFGLFDRESVRVTAKDIDDKTSGVDVEYYESYSPTPLTKEELDAIDEWKKYSDYDLDPDKLVVVYLKITDYAGNYTYISTDAQILDSTVSNITLTPSEGNGFYSSANGSGPYGIYNMDSDVYVDVKVEDPAPYSGINTVEYWIENNNVETERKTYQVYNSGTRYEDLENVWEGRIYVDKATNNGCNTVVYVKTTDNAGNETLASTVLDIDNTAPTIDVTFDNNEDNNGNTYFKDNNDNSNDAVRTATVVITERDHHFNSRKATEGIVINAKDVNGNDIENAYSISGWTKTEGTGNMDDTKWTATIAFEKDANYEWSISYTDEAGNTNNGVNTHDSVAPFDFTIDTTDPEGSITATSTEGREGTWEERVDELKFGFWSKESITVTGTSSDVTSPVASVEYYKMKSTSATDNTTALSETELDAITGWNDFEKLEITSDEQFVVYLKITDMAGNYTYISTNGLIVDHEAPMEETIAPQITVEPEQPINGIYNGDVKVDIKVTDPLTGGTYSGLKKVYYEVYNMGVKTDEDVLFEFDNEDPLQSELQQTWTETITVSSVMNNSNDVVVKVYAEDNALNASDDQASMMIDITKPTIDVSYDNNTSDNEKYFNADRTATIVIAERNFNADDVEIIISNTDGIIPAVAEWVKTEGTGNGDDTKWTTTINYNADGDYEFEINYTDLANNACDGAQYGDSVAPTEFTIDKTLPVISVSYDNNDVKNDKYFAAPRTATIVITEHNFDINRVEFTQTASLNGTAITVPSATWTHNGDIHTATIPYTADGDYTFDVKVTDMAANESEPVDYSKTVAGDDFVVDQTIEKPTIGGVKDKTSYKEDVVPTISFKDVNFDTYEVKLLRTRKGEKNVDVTKQFIPGIKVDSQGGSGSFDTFKKIVENDGIYTLSIKMIDKAGNEESEQITFSVNRFGSVYEYSDYLMSLIRNGGQYVTIEKGNKAAITEDLIITEYNADRLNAGSLKILITRDGQLIDAKYTSNPVVGEAVGIGESGWYQYRYAISADNFTKDGVYKITLTSQYSTIDSENNESTSVPENSFDIDGNKIEDTLMFTVDTVAPEIRNVINLDEKVPSVKKITDGKLNVKYTVVDVGGLYSVEVVLNGETIQMIIGNELVDNAFNYAGEFDILEQDSTTAQNVRIKVTDRAGNVTDTSSQEFLDAHSEKNEESLYVFFDEVTVSRNFGVRLYANIRNFLSSWYSNKLLFWGSIGTVAVLGGAAFIIILAKKKKKEDK